MRTITFSLKDKDNYSWTDTSVSDKYAQWKIAYTLKLRNTNNNAWDNRGGMTSAASVKITWAIYKVNKVEVSELIKKLKYTGKEQTQVQLTKIIIAIQV